MTLAKTLLACLAVCLLAPTAAFAPAFKPAVARQRAVKPLRLSSKDSSSSSSSNDEEAYADALARNKIRTDVRLFLTQRALQSFIGVLHECRDPHTVQWLEVRLLYCIVLRCAR
jgi:hypothetical protein